MIDWICAQFLATARPMASNIVQDRGFWELVYDFAQYLYVPLRPAIWSRLTLGVSVFSFVVVAAAAVCNL